MCFGFLREIEKEVYCVALKYLKRHVLCSSFLFDSSTTSCGSVDQVHFAFYSSLCICDVGSAGTFLVMGGLFPNPHCLFGCTYLH